MSGKPIPVILDTDIGDDIDDTWALAMLLKSPEVAPKLIVSDTDDTVYRAKLIAKMLEVAGRTDVEVGIGIKEKDYEGAGRQQKWVDGYDLSAFPGKIHEDGVQAIIDTIMSSDEPVRLVCIGPMPNIREALKREPGIAGKAHFIGMHGSFNYHHTTNLNDAGGEGQIAEWNVVCDIPAAQEVFSAPWLSATITPLDTCGKIVLSGARYQKVRNCLEPLMQAVIENYEIWSPRNEQSNPDKHSSVLFDTVAVYLAFTEKLIGMEEFGMKITGEGFTVKDPTGRLTRVAMNWTDLDAYLDFLVERLNAPVVKA